MIMQLHRYTHEIINALSERTLFLAVLVIRNTNDRDCKGAKPYKHTQTLTRNILVTVESNLKGN